MVIANYPSDSHPHQANRQLAKASPQPFTGPAKSDANHDQIPDLIHHASTGLTRPYEAPSLTRKWHIPNEQPGLFYRLRATRP